MGLHTIKKGLDLPIAGAPEAAIETGNAVQTVALLGSDYVGMKPTMRVQEGDRVKRGQVLFEDKKTPGVVYTAPGAGVVESVNRGERRAFLSIVIRLSESEQRGEPKKSEITAFESYTGKDPAGLSAAEIKALLVESGQWTAFRKRPFGGVPDPETSPHAIFVTAIDTNPLAPPVDAIVAGREADFEKGLVCVAKLTDGPTYLCKAQGSKVPGNPNTCKVEEFRGVHPAGTVGLHIHRLDPVYREKTVWHIGYQDVIAIGKLFSTGELDVQRVVALAGPPVVKPRLVRTRIGAATSDLTHNELQGGEARIISGSVFSGTTAQGPVLGYLGRYHNQISVLEEGRKREFLGWLKPGADKFSTIPAFVSWYFNGRKYPFTTSTNGSERAMVPIGMYENVMPLDILPTFLLRALVVGDVEEAERLGCLELEEEDLALCTFVCPGKYEYGPMLRAVLTQIEKEG